jgi:hypothetical protein
MSPTETIAWRDVGPFQMDEWDAGSRYGIVGTSYGDACQPLHNLPLGRGNHSRREGSNASREQSSRKLRNSVRAGIVSIEIQTQISIDLQVHKACSDPKIGGLIGGIDEKDHALLDRHPDAMAGDWVTTRQLSSTH